MADLATAVVLCIIQALFFISSHSLAPGKTLSSQCLSDACSLSTQLPEMLVAGCDVSAELLFEWVSSLSDLLDVRGPDH